MATDIPLGTISSRSEGQAYFGLALLTVVIAFAGFFPTFWRPLAQGTFHAHSIVYIHGGLFLGWTLLLALQTRPASQRPMRLHRTIINATCCWRLSRLSTHPLLAGFCLMDTSRRDSKKAWRPLPSMK